MGLDGQGIHKDYDETIRRSITTGYIIVPDNVDRVKFIDQCLRTERFSILVDDAGVMHNCFITKSALRDIKFPLVNQKLGSGVCFHSDPFSGKVIITGVVGTDTDELNKEEVVVFKRTKDGNYALLSIDGNGQVNIDVIGEASKGKLNINVRNDDYTAEVNIHVKGKISLYTEGNTEITARDGDITLVTNENTNITCDKDISLKSGNRLLVDKADEAMVRGGELQAQIDKTNSVVRAILQTITSPVINTATAGSPDLFQAALIAATAGKQVGDFSKIKSEKSFLE